MSLAVVVRLGRIIVCVVTLFNVEQLQNNSPQNSEAHEYYVERQS